MIILPAIDLKDKTAVRLYQGDFDTVHKVANDPLETAKGFEAKGALWLHIVDLDGALKGHPVNMDVIRDIVNETALSVEVGGGIRTMDTVDEYIKLGVKRVILGSVALTDPDLVKETVRKYGNKIAVGIDARNGKVKTGGWISGSETDFTDLAAEMDKVGVRTIIYTDIERDGTLRGPNLEDLNALNEKVGANIIASGGVRNIEDIDVLAALGLYGTICGKSIYTGDLDLSDALEIGRSYEIGYGENK